MNIQSILNQISIQSVTHSISKEFYSNLCNPLSMLLIQLILIIIASRLLGFLFRKLGQPTVMGEILAGIFLGPSLLGYFFPSFLAHLFPKDSLSPLHFFSQLGLILFMFIVGMELDIKILKNKTNAAGIIGISSIVLPFILGIFTAYYLYPQQQSSGLHTSFWAFALFMGIAMSITAFPVLARIIQERKLTKTSLGTLALTSAAVNDILGWCLLAAVIGFIRATSLMGVLFTILFSIIYIMIMIYVARPILSRMFTFFIPNETLNKSIVALIFILLLFSAYLTQFLGIHALFGAFLLGVIMPQNLHFRKTFIEKIEDISMVVLLPLFFVLTGLRTQIGLLNQSILWFQLGIILLAAIVGKIGGSVLSARYVGQSWQDALSIGALMNTRGLMELIVLNIGYDLGILSTQIFTMMVFMALATTFMTGPLLNLFQSKIWKKIPHT